MTKYKLGEIILKIMDFRGKTPKKLGMNWTENNRDILAISAKNVKNGKLINLDKAHYGNEELYKKWMKEGDIKKGDLLLTSEAPLGESFLVSKPFKAIISQRIFLLRPNPEIIDSWYFYLLSTTSIFKKKLQERATGTTVLGIKQKELLKIEVDIPNLKKQREIVKKIRPIILKSELNEKINTNLEEINKLYFSNIFKNTTNFIKASDIAEIKIGKTPPRKEKKWFSSEKGQIWVSIKDMNSSGSFILDSSEYLINNATNNFNIQKVSKNTVILSFKLTIGRVKITEQDMFTNEAIAQFKNAKLPFQFLYTYLKSFPYEILGSTSSIAKSINSKIVKNIPILHPEKYELDNYMSFAEPIFKEIELHQLENKKLLSIKDELLHRFFN